MKVRDEYTHREFTDLLYEAEVNAKSGWDMNFVEDTQERFDEYGIDAFLSDAQHDQLKRIARI